MVLSVGELDFIVRDATRQTSIGEDGIFFRGGAGPQFSPRRGRDFST